MRASVTGTTRTLMRRWVMTYFPFNLPAKLHSVLPVRVSRAPFWGWDRVMAAYCRAVSVRVGNDELRTLPLAMPRVTDWALLPVD